MKNVMLPGIIILLCTVVYSIYHFYAPNQSENKENKDLLKYSSKYDLKHLIQETQYVGGPIQDDEALLLFGLIKILRPKTGIELGFYEGFSSYNFLKALDEDAKLYSYDNDLKTPHNDKRFKFYQKSQTEFSFSDVDNQKIDFVFFDGSHDIDLNIISFEKMIKYLAPNAIIIIHDTGLHINQNSNKCLSSCDFQDHCGLAHQLGERKFVNWILSTYPNWNGIQLHSFNIHRHGITLLQKKYNLSMPNDC